MVSSSITSWQIEGEKVEAVTDFIFLGSKITADGNCSHEIKRCLLLRGKTMINIDSVLKSIGITWPTKFCIVKVMVFPVVMYRCKSCTIKDTGRGKERVRCVERVAWKLTLLYVEYIASGNFPCVSGNANRGSVST